MKKLKQPLHLLSIYKFNHQQLQELKILMLNFNLNLISQQHLLQYNQQHYWLKQLLHLPK